MATSKKAAAEKACTVELDEFCVQLSSADKRVEAIGAFNHVEKAAGNKKDTYANYMARFNDFMNKPM